MNTFHEAAALMERHGRFVGDLGNPDVGFCFVGAFFRAASGDAEEGIPPLPLKLADSMYEWGSKHVADTLGLHPVTFSDTAGTDAEVIAMLRELGDLWDAEHPAVEEVAA